jgi:hypothetical protein
VNENIPLLQFFWRRKSITQKKINNNQQNKSLICLVDKFHSFFVEQGYIYIYIYIYVHQKEFLQDLSLLIIKNHLPMQFVKVFG